MILELKQARQLIEQHGWVGPSVEPFCVARGPGVKLNVLSTRENDVPLLLDTKTYWTLDAHAEVMHRWSVAGACRYYGAEFNQLDDLLGGDFQAWLQVADRKVDDVLTALVLAIKRQKKTGER